MGRKALRLDDRPLKGFPVGLDGRFQVVQTGEWVLALDLAPLHRVSGHVVDCLSGRPVSNALVSIRDFSNEDARVAVHTDPLGRFDVGMYGPAGFLSLVVVAQGYSLQQHGLERFASAHPFLEVRLERPSERVIVGRVTDELGEPLEGAEVWVSKAHKVTTNARGSYRLPYAAPISRVAASLWVSVRKTGFLNKTECFTGWGRDRLDLKLKASKTLRGVLLNPDGTPAAGRKVGYDELGGCWCPGWERTLTRSGGDRVRLDPKLPCRAQTAVTNDRGEFELTGAAQGWLSVSAWGRHQRRLEGGADRVVWRLPPTQPRQGILTTRNGSPVAGIAVLAVPTGRLSPRAPSVRLRKIKIKASGLPWLSAATVTDAHGRFRLNNLQPGAYDLLFTERGGESHQYWLLERVTSTPIPVTWPGPSSEWGRVVYRSSSEAWPVVTVGGKKLTFSSREEEGHTWLRLPAKKDLTLLVERRDHRPIVRSLRLVAGQHLDLGELKHQPGGEVLEISLVHSHRPHKIDACTFWVVERATGWIRSAEKKSVDLHSPWHFTGLSPGVVDVYRSLLDRDGTWRPDRLGSVRIHPARFNRWICGGDGNNRAPQPKPLK